MAGRRNCEGYIDMTAYMALAAVEKEERKKKKPRRKKTPVKNKGGKSHA